MAALLGAVALAWALLGGRAPSAGPDAGAIGGVDACRKGPRFQHALALGPRAALGTSLTDVTGLALLDPDGGGERGTVYQHETWDDAGFLGPFVTDRHGNVFVAPVPLVSLVENPPEKQNRIYRVDTDSQVMRLFADLPPAAPPSGGSPFGVVGLAYDCDTDSLYASSLAGSTAAREAGRLFRVPLSDARAATHVDGVDAVGVAVFRGRGGKRLYYGLARAPEVHSMALTDDGAFSGAARTELSFSDRVAGGRRTVRKIRFTAGPEVVLHVIDFNYSLQVASVRLEDVLTYRYDPVTDGWDFVASETTP